MTNFKLVEELFNKLSAALLDIFTELELKEVKDFLSVGEYGLALETVIDIFAEENKEANSTIVSMVEELAIAMSLSPSAYTSRLRLARP